MSDVDLVITLNAEQAKAAIEQLGGKLDQTEKKARSIGDQLEEGMSRLKDGVSGIAEVAAKIAEGVWKVAEAAAESERNARALTLLGSAYAQVSIATQDTVSAQQALAVQQSLVQSGLRVTGEQLATITRRAREFALQTGGDSTQALEQLTDALRGGEAEGLRKFGLTADSTRGRVSNFEDAIRQMQGSMRGTAPAARTMSEELERTSRSWDEFKNGIAGTIAQALRLQEVFSALTRMLKDIQDVAADDRQRGQSPFRRYLEAAGGVARRLTGAVGEAGGQLYDQIASGQGPIGSSAIGQAIRAEAASAFSVTPERIAVSPPDGVGVPARVLDRPGQSSGGGGGNLGDLRAQVRDLETQAQAISALFRAADTAGAHTEAQLKRRITSLREAITAQNEFAAVQSAEYQRQEEVAQRDREMASAYIDQERQKAEAKKQAAQVELEALAKVAEEERRLAEQREQSLSLSQQFAQSFAQIADVSQTGAQALAKTATQAFGSLSGALRQHIRAVDEGKESIGEALKATLHETLLTLATESAVQAVFQTASGFARLALGDYPGAANSFLAAGLFAGTAALAGVGVAATVPAQAASAQPRQIEPAARAGSLPGRGGGDGNTTIVYNIAGNVFGRERGEEEIAQYYRGAQQRGLVSGS